jgi:hypothetical protein
MAANSDDPSPDEPSCYPIAFCDIRVRHEQMGDPNQKVPW